MYGSIVLGKFSGVKNTLYMELDCTRSKILFVCNSLCAEVALILLTIAFTISLKTFINVQPVYATIKINSKKQLFMTCLMIVI